MARLSEQAVAEVVAEMEFEEMQWLGDMEEADELYEWRTLCAVLSQRFVEVS